MPVTFQVVGNLADFGNDVRAGVKVRATATPGVKVGDVAVHSNEPETVVTDAAGAFTLELVSLPGVWYRIQTPYANAINSVNLAGYVPDVGDPTTGTAFPALTVINLRDVVSEDPTPGFDAIGIIDSGALAAEIATRAAADSALDVRVDVLEANPVPDVTAADLAAHAADATGVHGITDTAALVLTTDPRLSDDRDPTAHTHLLAEVTDAGTAAAANVGDFATAAQGTLADTATQPGDLATVATTGAYADLTGRPMLGTAAATAATAYATAAQGVKADSAVPGASPQSFGAVGNGVADDTTAMQSWLNSVPASGGTLYLPAGKYLVPSGGLTCSAPVQIIGAGTGSYETASGGARILCTSTTATLLTLNAPGSVVSGVTFENTSTIGTQTAGAALLCTDFDWGRVERCMFVGFWNQLQVNVGYFYSVRDTAFLRPVNFGAYMRNTAAGQNDHGDQVLEGCNFSKYGDPTDGGTAVKWESGGGLRIVGCKVNAGTQPGYTSTGFWHYGFHSAMTANTSVHTITGCSVEGFLRDGVKVEIASGVQFGKVSIAGNELLSSGVTAQGYHAIHLDGALGGFNSIAITGNVAYGGCGGVKVHYASHVVISGNNFRDCAGNVLTLTGARELLHRDNLSSTQILDNDAANTTESTRGRDRTRWDYSKGIYQLTTNASYGKINPAIWSAGVIRVQVTGDVATVGGVFMERQRAVTTTGAANNIVIGATIGTDVAVGPAAAELNITFDLTTQAWIKPTVTSVNGKSFTGAIQVEYRGRVTTWSYAN